MAIMDNEYSADDLSEKWLTARRLFTFYNKLPYDDFAERKSVLKELLGNCPEIIDIQSPFYCDYGFNISIGEHVFINFNCTILDLAPVNIGERVSIANNVQILTAYHPVNALERITGPVMASPVTIGNNVWLGAGAIICPGVIIGDNTTIGAGSVVTRNIPSNVLAVGNPCRVIKNL